MKVGLVLDVCPASCFEFHDGETGGARALRCLRVNICSCGSENMASEEWSSGERRLMDEEGVTCDGRFGGL